MLLDVLLVLKPFDIVDQIEALFDVDDLLRDATVDPRP